MKNIILKCLGLMLLSFGLVVSIPSTFCATEDTTSSNENSVESNCTHTEDNVLTRPLSYYCPVKYDVYQSFYYMTRDLFNIESPQFNYVGGHYDQETSSHIFQYQCKDHLDFYKDEMCSVTELDSTYNLVAVVNQNGDLYFICHSSVYDKATIDTQINLFISNVLSISEPTVSLDYTDAPKTSKKIGTYKNGNIYLRVESQLSVLKSSMEDAIYFEETGYSFPKYVYRSSDVSFDEALKLVAENCFSNNGELVKDYTYEYKVINEIVSIGFNDREDNKLYSTSFIIDEVKDYKGFVYTYTNNSLSIFLDSRVSQKDVADKYSTIMKSTYDSNMKYEFEYDLKDGLDETVEKVLRVENDKSFLKTKIRIKCTTFRSYDEESFLTKLRLQFNDFALKFDESKPLQVISYVLCSILTFFLTIGLIKLVSRAINVFKR